MPSESILVEYWLRLFSPWLASISLDAAVGGDVVQDPAQVIFIIIKNPYSTKPTIILNFSTPSLFLLLPTVHTQRAHRSTRAQLGSLSDKKWGITAFMDRKTPGGDNVMRYLSGGSTYPWKTMITLNLTEIENHAEVGTKIAKGFTKFCLDEKHNRPEKFVSHKVHYADEPK